MKNLYNLCKNDVTGIKDSKKWELYPIKGYQSVQASFVIDWLDIY